MRFCIIPRAVSGAPHSLRGEPARDAAPARPPVIRHDSRLSPTMARGVWVGVDSGLPFSYHALLESRGRLEVRITRSHRKARQGYGRVMDPWAGPLLLTGLRGLVIRAERDDQLGLRRAAIHLPAGRDGVIAV